MLRVLNHHLLREFIRGFLLTVTVLTLVMYVGATVQAIDYMSRGISGTLILRIFALNVPFTLSFVIPVSVLTTVLLQFGRLSADGEITALKACGVSLWQIAAPIVLCALLLSALCLFINAEIAPRSHYLRYKMLRELGEVNPLALLEEGRFISDFPGVKIYVGTKSGARLEDIVLYQFGEAGARAEIRARVGQVTCDFNRQVMNIRLDQARLTEYDQRDPNNLANARTLTAESYPVTLDLRNLLNKGTFIKKPASLSLDELLRAIQNVRQTFPDLLEPGVPRMRIKLAVEASKRLALALSCFSFAMLGIPLGIRAHRKESSLGIGIALALLFVYYLFIIVADSLLDRPDWRPDLIPWIPVLGGQLLGGFLLHRNR